MGLLQKIERHYKIKADDYDNDKPDYDNDIFLEDTGPLGSLTSVSFGRKHLGNFKSNEEAEDAIVKQINKTKDWPNIWYVSDHGNIAPYKLEKKFADQIKI